MTETVARAAGTGSVMVGVAQRPGTVPACADGLDVQRRGAKLCAAVVDGAGHQDTTVRYASIAPKVMTHTGMVMGGLAGLVTAGQMAQAYETPPHVSAVYACVEPGWPTSVHWIGDCRAYGWDGSSLTQWTRDQTMGQWLRVNGVAVEIAEDHDNWSRVGLAQATAATCRQVEIPEETSLVLLVSDGVSDQVDLETAEALCRTYAADPQALAEALVDAAEDDAEGYRDDASVIVLLRV
ncbi:PP2C family protein-serine/threonine phosphatase [Streptomyces noursei]|uniref:PP2C family protein-serine/threonine phosphatase n=1 Tax=Streptomyces noursei TaxID=1971 RepID=UPI0005C8A2C7|nr:SpoIIE family protein phosphatase [Streptomyces noursei]